MTRNFKISFPLPRRPSASPSAATPGSEYSNLSRHDDSPLSHPGSKAERVLGAVEPERPESKKKQSRKEKGQLRKFPSFMSVTLSDVDGDTVQASDGFPFPGHRPIKEDSLRPTQHLGRQGSSPLLGELYNHGPGKGDYANTATAPQAHRAESLTTLRSHYDPGKVPLPISQQTSASSARDLALRKGFPPISSPTGFHKVGGFNDSDAKHLHSRNVSGDSKVSATSKLSGNSMKRINGVPRRRPSVTDPPTLYPNAARANFHAVSPPSALINSSLPKTLPPNGQPTKSKWWHKKSSSPKASPPIANGQLLHQEAPLEDDFSPIKVNVRKPKPGITGARNWFDGLDDDEQTLQDLQHYENPQPIIPDKSVTPLSIYEMMSQRTRSATTSRKSSFSAKTMQAPSGRKLSFRLDHSPERAPRVLTSPHSIPGSPQAKSTRSVTQGKGARQGMNLLVESFLELSSSEDESGEGSAPSRGHAPYHRHHIRASIERTSYHSEVSLSNAQHAQPVKINTRTSSRPLSKRSTSSEVVPPLPRIPDRSIRLVQRTSSMRWREMLDEKAASTESTVDSGASSLHDNGNSRNGQSSRINRPRIRASKLMKVTSEEERLLEAMRDKRASIRHDDFEKGFKTAMQLQDIVARPKTSGADGRNSRTSAYGSRSSVSSLMAVSRLSASADDMLLDDAYPFPEVPFRGAKPPNLHIKSPMGSISAPKTSPSLSFDPSDILPSTPASRNSPITPPSIQTSSEGYGRYNMLSPSRGVFLSNQLGHERKSTTSSSVVMLDGVEQQAQELDEADEISGWAMNRW